MLDYEWTNQSPPPPQLILTDDVHHHHHNHDHDHHDPSSNHHHRPIFDDPFSTVSTFPHDNPLSPLYNLPLNHQPPLFTDPRAFPSASFPPPPPLDPLPCPAGYPYIIPKVEPDYPNRIGLNLGGRTYFSTDDDFVNRLYRRSRPAESAVNLPRCQAEGCSADLSHAKHYHRRHKVCEFHSKASTVVAAGLTQRFCQQCSRFHLLSEFDNGKRSCRKRLADHNRRRRKSQQHKTHQHHDHRHSSSSHPENIQRSPPDSGVNSSSSVTVAISSPQLLFDSNFRQSSYDE